MWGCICTCGQKNLSQILEPFIFLSTTMCVNFFTCLIPKKILAPDYGHKAELAVSGFLGLKCVRIVFIPCCNLITTLFLIKTKFAIVCTSDCDYQVA